MNELPIALIGRELGLREKHVRAALALLEDGKRSPSSLGTEGGYGGARQSRR